MAKQGDTGRSRRPAKDDDDAPAPRKKDSGSNKALKKQSARKSARVPDEGDDDDDAPRPKKKGSARNSAPGGAPRSNEAAERNKRLFLYATPFTLLLLLGVGAYLYSLPEPKQGGTVVKDYNQDVDQAKAKYAEAFKIYKEGLPLEGEAGAAKLRQAKNLLFEAQEIINKVRDECDKDDAKDGKSADEKDKDGHVKYYPFEDTAQKIDMLIEDVNKQMREKL